MNHGRTGMSMATAVADLGLMIGSVMDARHEANTQRRLQRYEQVQDQLLAKIKSQQADIEAQRSGIESLQELCAMRAKNLATAEHVIAKYKEEVMPEWERVAGSLKGKMEAARAENQVLNGTLAQAQADLAQAKTDFAQAQSQLAVLGKDLTQAREQEQAAKRVYYDARNQVEGLEQEVQRKSRSIDTFQAWHAANLTLRCALEMQLLRADPENPLLHDQELRNRVRRAGETSINMSIPGQGMDPFDVAREAGLSFSVPGRPSGVQVLAELALTEVYMRRLAFLHADQKDGAWSALQKVQIGQGSMTAAQDLLREMEPQSPLLHPSTMQQVRDMAMDEFQNQQRARRSQKGPSAAWSAAVSASQPLCQRAVKGLELIIQRASEAQSDAA
ncbi:hypothetical protein SRAA_1472 [Serpentinimonas raichei]|uniref:Uncharacterized protein n=1 Tax=Serpentinimonas raichei TaxID=1458425 RepID=A0A060NHI1_9BURK|nr:hypothetical protein [Serpentinimonas raichei]BAO81326.1 hypothetical protein SRAA_1472 [Serpentinimonas raichei]